MGIPGPNDPDTAYSGGSGGVGAPCVFFNGDTPAPGHSVTANWEADEDLTFIDARVNSEDATQIEILTAGIYLLVADIAVHTDAEADPTDVRMNVSRNAGGFDAFDKVHLEGGIEAVTRIVFPVEMAANDLITAQVANDTEDLHVADCLFSILRLG